MTHSLRQHDHGEGSLHRVLSSPTYSESSKTRKTSNDRKTRKLIGSSRQPWRQPTPNAYAEKKRTTETYSKGVGASTKRSCKPRWATRMSSPPPIEHPRSQDAL